MAKTNRISEPIESYIEIKPSLFGDEILNPDGMKLNTDVHAEDSLQDIEVKIENRSEVSENMDEKILKDPTSEQLNQVVENNRISEPIGSYIEIKPSIFGSEILNPDGMKLNMDVHAEDSLQDIEVKTENGSGVLENIDKKILIDHTSEQLNQVVENMAETNRISEPIESYIEIKPSLFGDEILNPDGMKLNMDLHDEDCLQDIEVKNENGFLENIDKKSMHFHRIPPEPVDNKSRYIFNNSVCSSSLSLSVPIKLEDETIHPETSCESINLDVQVQKEIPVLQPSCNIKPEYKSLDSKSQEYNLGNLTPYSASRSTLADDDIISENARLPDTDPDKGTPYRRRRYSEKPHRLATVKHRTAPKSFCCIKCGKSFNYLSTLNRHMHVHSGEKPYSCTKCAKTFAYSNSLKEHMRIHGGFEPLFCVQCGKPLTQVSHLNAHLDIHPGEKTFACSDCDEAFTRGSSLKQRQLLDSCDQPYRCTDCGKIFTNNSHLKAHMHIHSGEKPFSCTVCGSTFTRGSSLKRHKFIHSGDAQSHTGTHEKRFSCFVCEKTYSQLYDLKSHIRSHSGEKPFSCNECEKEFTSSKGLKQHQLIHLGVKQYCCSECGKTFTQKGHLNTHGLTHSGEKRFSCSECGKTFARASNLKEHQLLHLDVKPFCCDECGKTFTRLSYLNTHRSRHASGKISSNTCYRIHERNHSLNC